VVPLESNTLTTLPIVLPLIDSCQREKAQKRTVLVGGGWCKTTVLHNFKNFHQQKTKTNLTKAMTDETKLLIMDN